MVSCQFGDPSRLSVLRNERRQHEEHEHETTGVLESDVLVLLRGPTRSTSRRDPGRGAGCRKVSAPLAGGRKKCLFTSLLYGLPTGHPNHLRLADNSVSQLPSCDCRSFNEVLVYSAIETPTPCPRWSAVTLGSSANRVQCWRV